MRVCISLLANQESKLRFEWMKRVGPAVWFTQALTEYWDHVGGGNNSVTVVMVEFAVALPRLPRSG